MSGKKIPVGSSQFILFSVFLLSVILISTFFWRPLYDLMAEYMKMRSEYSLPEQATKFILLILMGVALLAYRNEKDPSKIALAITLLLFPIAMYFSESNFIHESWQPLFGAVFILAAIWQLLKINFVALLFLLGGCTIIVMGMAGDFWSEHPDILDHQSPLYALGGVLYSLEEHLDLWGVALFVYAGLIAFRETLCEFMVKYPVNFVLLVISAGLIAAGNGFAHWQYHPNNTLIVAATIIAFIGLSLLIVATKRQSNLTLQFGFFDNESFYRNCFLVFLVLPIIFGGITSILNLILSACYFAFSARYLYNNNPRLKTSTEAS